MWWIREQGKCSGVGAVNMPMGISLEERKDIPFLVNLSLLCARDAGPCSFVSDRGNRVYSLIVLLHIVHIVQGHRRR